MKVLVSTRKTQGERGNDFCFVSGGELVTWGWECDGEKPDEFCGCRRSMAGIEGFKYTTTFTVIDSPIRKARYASQLKRFYRKAWQASPTRSHFLAQSALKKIQRLTRKHKEGTILERRGSRIYAR